MHLNQKEAEEDQGRMWVMLMLKSGAQEYPLLFHLPYHFHFCLPAPPSIIKGSAYMSSFTNVKHLHFKKKNNCLFVKDMVLESNWEESLVKFTNFTTS